MCPLTQKIGMTKHSHRTVPFYHIYFLDKCKTQLYIYFLDKCKTQLFIFIIPFTFRTLINYTTDCTDGLDSERLDKSKFTKLKYKAPGSCSAKIFCGKAEITWVTGCATVMQAWDKPMVRFSAHGRAKLDAGGVNECSVEEL
jgi:hypothetical protein